jgi:hypothetical protein
MSQIRTVPSWLLEASQLPPGPAVTAATGAVWPIKGHPFLPGYNVPDPHCPVVAAGGEPAAIWRYRDRQHPRAASAPGMARQDSPFLPGCHVPDPYCPVVAAGGEPAAIWRYRDRRYRGGMVGEHASERGVR